MRAEADFASGSAGFRPVPRHATRGCKPVLPGTVWVMTSVAAIVFLAGSLARSQELVEPKGRCVTNAEDGTKGLPRRFAEDQRDLWTSPANLRWRDAKWLPILGGTVAGLMTADHAIMQQNSLSPQNIRRSTDFSNLGVGALVGMGGGLYLWGKLRKDDHNEETGLLSGESALNSVVVASVLQGILGRERPNVDGAQGRFFRGGTSFPSDHSAVAWSVASMIAHENPRPVTKLFAYGLAGAVSLSRVTGKDHFPSDVLVGGALGWLAARQTYHKRHDPELGGEAWNFPSGNEGGEKKQGFLTQATPYVPLDSWVYPVLERLAALGYIHSEFLGSRPWTRSECARLVQEAGTNLVYEEMPAVEAHRLYDELAEEFTPEIPSAGDVTSGEESGSVRVESIYTRLLGISGEPLNDSYHFGETLINDFGRPYQRGFDPITGFSGWTNWGRVALYVRGEYQHSPSAPAYSQDVRDWIAKVDLNPVQPATPVPTINQFALLDTYALTKVDNWDISFGKQSLWWGPTEGGSLLMSDNAEPMYMFRVSRDMPLTLPGIFERLGAVKGEAFIGKLSGNQFPPRPLFHGERISFKPTRNLEFSFSRTAEFGGVGRPLTLGAFLNTYLAPRSSFQYPAWDNPGQRNGGFDIAYRWPGVRKWVTVYASLMSRDDITPLFAFFPVRALMSTGLYVSHFPRLRRLDFRAEGVTTDPRNGGNKSGNFAYWEAFYHDDYTNRNNLMGDWIGRVGTGYQLWSTYWFAPRTSVQFGYRHAQVASTFVPHGGTLNDGSVRVNWQMGRELSLSAYVQYENWLMTLLAPQAKNNLTTALQLTFWPRNWGVQK